MKKKSTFPDRLQEARIRSKVGGVREAARAFGWNENTYKSHENGMRGEKNPPQSYVRLYARRYRVSFQWLLTGEGSPDDPSPDNDPNVVDSVREVLLVVLRRRYKEQFPDEVADIILEFATGPRPFLSDPNDPALLLGRIDLIEPEPDQTPSKIPPPSSSP